MKNSALQSEPFFYIPSERENEFLEMEQLEYLESEVNRNSSDFRWVQESLNKVLKLRLKVDGVLGAQTRSAIRSFQQRQGLVADGIIGKKTESALKSALGGATVGTVTPPIPPVSPRAPRVLTYTTKDVIDNRISVPAQNSLVRLSKNPTTSSDAVGMLEEVKAGRLAGIYCVNWEKPAKRAIRFGKTWWTVIPKGEDAVLTLDPENLMGRSATNNFSPRVRS